MSGGNETDGIEKRLNLHIFLSSIESETRFFKEAHFTRERGIFSRVVVLGLWRRGLKKQELTPSGLEVRRLTVLIRQFGDKWPLSRIPLLRKAVAVLSMVQFCVLALLRAGRLRPSHVSCHNVTLLPLCWAVARTTGGHLVYVPHELETLRAGLGGFSQKLQIWMERTFIQSATAVVVVCEPIADWYRKKYNLNNVHVVRNLPEREAVVVKPVPSGSFRERFAVPDCATVFIYQGIFGKARGTDKLLEIFSRLDPQAGHLIFMGYGEEADEAAIADFAGRCSNIHFQPAVPREWIISYSSGADVGLLISQISPLSYRYSLPNKFFEYAHAGVPILVSDNFEHQAEIITEEGIGWSAPFEEIEQTIRELTRTDLSPYRSRAQEFARSAVWEADAQAYELIYHSC